MKYQEKRLYEFLKQEKTTRINNTELSEMFRVTTRTISTSLRTLAEQGYITRERFFEDGKNVRVITFVEKE